MGLGLVDQILSRSPASFMTTHVRDPCVQAGLPAAPTGAWSRVCVCVCVGGGARLLESAFFFLSSCLCSFLFFDHAFIRAFIDSHERMNLAALL